MEIGNDLIASLRGRLGHRSEDPAESHPDWSVLQARHAAAHAARRELLMDRQGLTRPSGSFGRSAAKALAGDNDQRGVNRTDLVDGKYPGGMDGLTAEATLVGGRGR